MPSGEATPGARSWSWAGEPAGREAIRALIAGSSAERVVAKFIEERPEVGRAPHTIQQEQHSDMRPTPTCYKRDLDTSSGET